mmetsp:Transcript_128593/g.274296  ORF Transcript_128593/g.274296 Transcript_128593/m.274296 type:complete len:405 (-) Transcript_128593:382-1596(-)
MPRGCADIAAQTSSLSAHCSFDTDQGARPWCAPECTSSLRHGLLPRARMWYLVQLGQGSGSDLRELSTESLQALLSHLRDDAVVGTQAHCVFLAGGNLALAAFGDDMLEDVEALHLGLVSTARGEGCRSLALSLTEGGPAVGELRCYLDLGIGGLLLGVGLGLRVDATYLGLRLRLDIAFVVQNSRLQLRDLKLNVGHDLLRLHIPVGLELGDVLFGLGHHQGGGLCGRGLHHLRILLGGPAGIVTLLFQLRLALHIIQSQAVEGLLHAPHGRLRLEKSLVLELGRHPLWDAHILHGKVMHFDPILLKLLIHLLDDSLCAGAVEVVDVLDRGRHGQLTQGLVLRRPEQVIELLRPDGVDEVTGSCNFEDDEHVDVHSDGILRLAILDRRVEDDELFGDQLINSE